MKSENLGSIADIVMGQSPKGETCNSLGEGLPLLNGPTEFGLHHPDPVQFTTDAKKVAEAGDLLFCVRGSTTGRMNWADQKYAIGRGVAAIRHKKGLNFQPFVKAVIAYRLPELLMQATGSTFPNVSRSQLSDIPVNVTDESAQQSIAHIFGTLDDKIELNHKMNQTLEQIAQAIFKSWFVDFDPVRAKMEGKKPFGMDEETAALFPDGFEKVDGREVPRGWKMYVLDEMLDFMLGGDWGKAEPSKDFSEKAYCIRGTDIPSIQKGHLGGAPIRYLKSSSVKKRRLQPGDLVVEVSGGSPTQTTGRTALIVQELVDYVDYPIVVSNFCRMLRPNSSMYSYHLYLWMSYLYGIDKFGEYEIGTTGIKNLAIKDFTSSESFFLPEREEIIQSFNQVIGPQFQAIQGYSSQSITLASIRDALLPRLISGELPVPTTFK